MIKSVFLTLIFVTLGGSAWAQVTTPHQIMMCLAYQGSIRDQVAAMKAQRDAVVVNRDKVQYELDTYQGYLNPWNEQLVQQTALLQSTLGLLEKTKSIVTQIQEIRERINSITDLSAETITSLQSSYSSVRSNIPVRSQQKLDILMQNLSVQSSNQARKLETLKRILNDAHLLDEVIELANGLNANREQIEASLEVTKENILRIETQMRGPQLQLARYIVQIEEMNNAINSVVMPVCP